MIRLTNLQKVIDHHTVIAIDLMEVQEGEIAAVVGPRESGKEVLFDLLIGKSRPTAGTVRLGELDPATDKSRFSRRVGVLFAEDTLYKNQSAQANLTFLCRLYGLPRSRATEILADVGLADHARISANKLSPGLRRRLAFGRAILHSPEILLLVDPFANCDEASISLLRSLIRRKADEGNTALIMAENSAQLATLCDTIIILDQGRVVDVKKPADEQESSLPFKIPVRLEGSVALINPADVLYALAQEGRTYLQTDAKRYPSQYTMTELEERLAPRGFFRAHRGYLVNLQHVQEVIPYTRSSFSLKLNDDEGTLIPLSKDAARELRELLGY
ncbi:MAG: LytTR family transcriptional regulator DNA-binding domain-containing protein [Candidatus Promineifilaceae bacterium]